MTEGQTIEEPKIEPVAPKQRRAAIAAVDESADESQASFNRAEHDELEALAIAALADIQKEIAGIPPSQLPDDVAALRGNLTAALHSLQSTPRHMRVPSIIRNAIRDNAKFISSGQLEHEIEANSESADHKIKNFVHEIEVASKSVARHSATFAFLGRSRDDHHDRAAGSARRLTPLQEAEYFIGHGTHRTQRKIHGNGFDRTVVAGIGSWFGTDAERVADEVVWDAESTVRKSGVGIAAATSGAGEILSGDVEGARKQARTFSRGLKRTMDRFIGNENAEYIAHGVGDVLENAGVAGATVSKTIQDGASYAWNGATSAASSAYDTATSLIWGKPPKGAQTQTVTLNGRAVEWHEAARKLAPYIKDMDKNGDKKWSLEEVRAAAETWNKAQAQQRNAVGQARAGADTNHDGKIDKAELMAAIAKAGKTFAQADTNHDGKISNGELAALTASHGGAKPQRSPAKGHH